MNCKNKVFQLRKNIEDVLIPLIDNDYIYLDLPYHANLGDTLIWQGTLDFLKNINYKCLMSTYACGRDFIKVAKKHPKAIILLHGGGNFGDVWTGSNEFRKNVIRALPNHKIIILPQTIYYKDENNLECDALFYSKNTNVIICARDRKSLNILETRFPNNQHLLLPDMAFCMNVDVYRKTVKRRNAIFIKRMDKELSNDNTIYDIVPNDADISDWPTIENNKLKYKFINIINRYANAIRRHLKINLFIDLYDLYWHLILKNKQLFQAVGFIDKYENIYTTRMHAVILGVLLEKSNIIAFDNSYGKTSSFIESWLSDVDNLKLIK